jgi:hypothetical protein
MDLWSKGLGRLVLTLRLSERKAMEVDEHELVMKGTMGKPTYWDWSVNLDDSDVVDFLVFLQRPAPVRYLVESDKRWQMLKIALEGAVLFLVRTLRIFIFGAPKHELGATAAEANTAAQTSAVTPNPAEEKQ